MRPSRRVTAMLAAVVLLAACATGIGDESPAPGATSPDGGATATAPSAAPSPSASPSRSASDPDEVAALLDVSGRLLDGGEFAFADAAGDQLVLWMWAPW